MAKGIYLGVSSKAQKIKKAYIGVDGKARKIKKMYIGDANNKARLFFSSGSKVVYHGVATPLSSNWKYTAATATIGDYALFAGGYLSASASSTSFQTSVDAYDKSLTHSMGTALPEKKYKLGSATVGKYALFGGGVAYNDGSNTASKTVCAYDDSLTMTVVTDLKSAVYNSTNNITSATSFSNYAVFDTGRDSVSVYDATLTQTTVQVRSYATGNGNATLGHVGNYAIAVGGAGESSTRVYVLDSSLTCTDLEPLSDTKSSLATVTIGNYVLFSGGNKYVVQYDNTEVLVYDSSLTKSIATPLSRNRTGVAATNIDDFAIFAGGYISGTTKYVDTVDIYDTSLTRTVGTSLSVKRDNLSAASVGDYALFGAGRSESNNAVCATVDVYRLE